MPMNRRVLTKKNIRITIAALAGGAFDLTTGALLPGAESFEVELTQNDLVENLEKPERTPLLLRGEFYSSASADAVMIEGDAVPKTFSFDNFVVDLGSASYATLESICNPSTTDYVATNWEATHDSSAGCAEVFTVDVKIEYLGSDRCAGDWIRIYRDCTLDMSLTHGYPTTGAVSGSALAWVRIDP